MIYVLTATIPGRENFLNNLIKNLENQTFKDFKHIIYKDVNLVGNYHSYNELLNKVPKTENDYITFVDDDDVLYPNHLQEFWSNKDKASIIYNLCDLDDPLEKEKKQKYIWYNEPFNIQKFKNNNMIPITAFFKSKDVLDVTFEQSQDCDFKFWKKLVFEKNLSVYQNQVKTWQYVFHENNFSRKNLTN